MHRIDDINLSNDVHLIAGSRQSTLETRHGITRYRGDRFFAEGANTLVSRDQNVIDG
jgi:hypothetical protein